MITRAEEHDIHYNTNTYPQVLKTMTNVIDGTPRVQTFETVISTFHNVPVAV